MKIQPGGEYIAHKKQEPKKWTTKNQLQLLILMQTLNPIINLLSSGH